MARLAALDTGERDRALAGILLIIVLAPSFPDYIFNHAHIYVLTINLLIRIGEDKS